MLLHLCLGVIAAAVESDGADEKMNIEIDMLEFMPQNMGKGKVPLGINW